jgi:hypothetical protein
MQGVGAATDLGSNCACQSLPCRCAEVLGVRYADSETFEQRTARQLDMAVPMAALCTQLRVDGQRRVGCDKAFLAHLLPEAVGNRDRQRRMVFGDPVRAAAAWDYRGGRRMGEREL